MLAPESVQVPAPALIKVPTPVPITPLIDPLAAPSSVRLNAPPMPPVRLMSPAVATMLLAKPSVINPLYVAAVAALLISAPLLDMPKPLSVSASAVPSVNPFKSSTAPLATVVPPATVPRGVFTPSPAAPSLSVPALTVVVPLYVLAPDSVSVPVPFLVSPNPAPPLISAEMLRPSAALVVVTVRVAPPRSRLPLIDALAAPPLDVMLPPSASTPAAVVTLPPLAPLLTVSAPIVSENPNRS